ncbi:hypothetical protein BJX99DRAFT_268149 [Aspergillus californicus]
MSDTRHFCPLCPASFRRQEHLDRHRMCHKGDRPFSCTFCSQSFKRSDVLQRHWRTCKARLDAGAGIPKIPASARPQKRRACERCARLKKACSLGSPCEACRSRKQECIYRHSQRSEVVRNSPADSVTSIFGLDDAGFPLQDFSLAALDTEESYMTPSDTFRSLVDSECALSFAQFDSTRLEGPLTTSNNLNFGKFCFLDKFTSGSGFVGSFECMRVPEVKELAVVVTDMLFKDPLDIGSYETYTDISPFGLSLQFDIESAPSERFPDTSRSCTEWLSDPVATITNSLVCALREVTQNRGPGSPVTLNWSPIIEGMCTQFFSPPNIRRYLLYFWTFWYPNCPIIHKPTFDIHSTPHTLLLSMLLIGASFAPEKSVNRNAKIWFDSAEEMVFADDHFRHAVSIEDGVESNFRRRNALKAVQGAYLICLLQNWEGNDDSKRRIRRVRFSMVTSIARELGFSPGSYHYFSADNEDWDRFVAQEEFNRTLSYVFLLDTAFLIFNNTPPKVSVSELNIDPVCSERCFQAPTAAECFHHLSQGNITTPITKYSITALVSQMCHGTLSEGDTAYIAHLGNLNLFILVSAFHTLLFHARNTFAPQAAILPIQQGLNNWKTVWTRHEVLTQSHEHYPTPENCWQRTGFIQYAPEYCTLAQAIISSVQTLGDPKSSASLGLPLSRFDENDMKQVNDFLKWVSNVGLLQV